MGEKDGSMIRCRGKLGCSGVAMKASANPTESVEAGWFWRIVLTWDEGWDFYSFVKPVPRCGLPGEGGVTAGMSSKAVKSKEG